MTSPSSADKCYVPQFYQSNFYDPAEKAFWVYDKQGGVPRKALTLGAAQESPSPAEAEELFPRLEADARPLIDRLVKGQTTFSPEEREILSEFMALQYVRVPGNMDAQKQCCEVLVADVLKVIAEDVAKLKEQYDRYFPDQSVAPDVFRERLLAPAQPCEGLPAEKALTLDLCLQTISVAWHLAQLNWTVCDTPPKAFFVTGDMPLAVFAAPAEGKALFGYGFGLPRVEAHFPLSSGKCLYMGFAEFPTRMQGKKSWIWELNKRSIFVARRWVAAPFDSGKIREFIDEIRTSPPNAESGK